MNQPMKNEPIKQCCKDLWEVIDSFQNKITELESQNKWISVEDRLPLGCSRNYLTYRPSAPIESRVSSTWYDPNYNGWSGKYSVTHWMPLPAPPSKVKSIGRVSCEQ